MPNFSARDIGEFLAFLGIIVSLVFVGLELRQSTIASRATAYQELGIATADIWFLQASNRELNDVFWHANGNDADYSDMSESDKNMFLSHQIATLRLYETVYLQVEQGLLEQSAMESLGWSGFESQVKNIWPDVEMFVDPAFAEYLKSIGAIPN